MASQTQMLRRPTTETPAAQTFAQRPPPDRAPGCAVLYLYESPETAAKRMATPRALQASNPIGDYSLRGKTKEGVDINIVGANFAQIEAKGLAELALSIPLKDTYLTGDGQRGAFAMPIPAEGHPLSKYFEEVAITPEALVGLVGKLDRCPGFQSVTGSRIRHTVPGLGLGTTVLATEDSTAPVDAFALLNDA